MQSERGSSTRPVQAKTGRPLQNRGSFSVAPDPVAGAGFSFERAQATQCVSHVKYTVPECSAEREHFTKGCIDVLKLLPIVPVEKQHTLMQTVADVVQDEDSSAVDQAFSLLHVKYGQLEKSPMPGPISVREPPRDSPDFVPTVYETYDALETTAAGTRKLVTWVQAPYSEGGHHYILKDVRNWPTSVRLVFRATVTDHFDLTSDGEPADGTVMHALQFSKGYRSTANVYTEAQKAREECVTVTVGEINPATGNFTAWEPKRRGSGTFVVQLGSTTDAHHLFYLKNWTQAMPTANPNAETFGDSVEPQSRLRYQFEVFEDRLCEKRFTHKNAEGDAQYEYVALANFYVVSMLATYMFVDGAHMPYHKLLCRHLLSSSPASDDVTYLAVDYECRTPSTAGCKYLDVEVLVEVSTLRSQADVRALFKKYHVNLDAANLTSDHLACVMLGLEYPTPTAVIVRFGRQATGLFVAGNCAFHNGTFMTHEEAGVAIVPTYFEENNITKKDYPRHIIIDYPHVRYAIGVSMWHKFMPAMFQNNLMAARAALCMGAMGLHASKIWSGQSGVGHGMPFAWIVSREAGTGKTEAVSLVHSMLGYHRSALVSGDVTKPAMFERLSLQSDLTVVIDDVVFQNTSVSGESRAYSQLGRAIFDRTSRAVMNKTRLPYSSAMFTSNQSVNDTDRAFQSRIILITFDALQQTEGISATTYSDWQRMRELFSSLVVDFESLLWHGKLDNEAIQDCALYMQAAIGKHRDRNANMWGILLYYMLLINSMFQSLQSAQEEVFEWMICSVTRASHEYNNHSGILDQFVIALSQVRADCGTAGLCNPLGSMDKTVFWHNLRTTSYIGGHVAYISVRVEAVCAVIKQVLKRDFKPNEINAAVEKVTWAVQGRAYFYDAAANKWPIARSELDEANARVLIPLSEAELDPDSLKQMRCVHLQQQTYDKMLTSVEDGGSVDTNYKNIVIKSANPDIGDYDFYAAACALDGNTWYGYRALSQGTFGTFCGALDTLAIGTPLTDMYTNEAVLLRNENQGGAELTTLYSAACLLNYFKYNFDELYSHSQMPAAYAENPFLFVLGGAKPINEEHNGEEYCSVSSQGECEDDKQSNGERGENATRVHPGSTPMRDVSNSINQDATRQGLKRKQQQARVVDDDGDNHKVEQAAYLACVSQVQAHELKGG